MALPYAPSEHYRPRESRIPELLMRQGEIAARRAERSGEIWSQAAQQVGGAVAGAVQQYGEQKREEKAQQAMGARDAGWADFVEAGEWQQNPQLALTEGVRRYGPKDGPKMAEALLAVPGIKQGSLEERLGAIQKVVNGFDALSPAGRARFWPQVAGEVRQSGLFPPESVSDEYDDASYSDVSKFVKGMTPEKVAEGFSLSPGQVRFDAQGQQIAVAPLAEKPPGTHVVGGNLVDDSGKVLFTAPKDPATGRAGEIKETDQGFVVVDPTTGRATPVTMGGEQVKGPKGLKSVKPSTGIEKKAVSFFNRMRESEDIAGKLETSGELSPLRDAATSGVPLVGKIAGGFLNSQANQSYRQAQRAFTEARLRKESGAAVPQEEYDNDARTYFVQPGDSAATIAQKAAGRRTVMQGIANESGTAFDEFYGEEAEAQREKLKAGAPAAPDVDSLRKQYDY